MSDIAFPSLSEILRNLLMTGSELFVLALSFGAMVVLPIAGVFVTRERARVSPPRQRFLGWVGLVVVVVLVGITGVGIGDLSILQLEPVPWIVVALVVLGGPWLWWVTTTKPKTRVTWAALVAVYFSAVMTVIWTMLAYQ